MNINIVFGERDSYETQDMLIKDEQGTTSVIVLPLCESPGDAIIGQDLISCEQIALLMERAYKAGKNGEDFTITQEEE